jgi:hypothetical protein
MRVLKLEVLVAEFCSLMSCGFIFGAGMLGYFCVTLQLVSCSIAVRVLLKKQQYISTQLGLRCKKLRCLLGFLSGINYLTFLLFYEGRLQGNLLQNFQEKVRV